jgi:NodT family efflux transporter outer membrane factor (OMF) lipoprotein
VKLPKLLGALIFVGAASGCAMGPNYQTPSSLTPKSFLEQSGMRMRASAATDRDLAQWWRSLRDRELDSLIARAFQSNPDIEAALDRLQQARAQLVVVAGQALPVAGASGGAGMGTGSDETKGRAEQALRAGETTTGVKSINEAGGLDAGWELDLFGRIRREFEAKTDDAEALKDARDWVFATIAADVARAYIDMRAQQSRLAVLDRGIAAAQSSQNLAQTRFDRGLTNEMDVTLAKRELALLQADVAPLTAQIAISRHVIAVLMGRFPEDLAGELTKPGPIPSARGPISIGAPPDLLRRRPDISETERRLAAATARIGVATAELFPTAVLTGAGGAQGGVHSSSGVPVTWIGSLGPSVNWPLLDFGALDAQIEVADLETREQLVRYKQAILSAVQQVDDAAADYRARQESLRNLDSALAAARQATQIATERYDRGLTDFLNVLDAEREEFDIEQRRVATRQAAADALVALYKALGGGWSNDEPIPPLRTSQPAAVAAMKHLLAPEQAN